MDSALVDRLVRGVQDALEVEATRHSDNGGTPMSEAQQEALALSVLNREFRRIDEERLAAGSARLSPGDESRLIDEVVAATVGLGAMDLLLADPTVEEISATRHDLVWVVRAGGEPTLAPHSVWRSERELADWLSHLARTKGRTERQFNAQKGLPRAGRAGRR